MATSVLHIKTKVECKVFLFDEEKGIATPGRYFNLEVRKGEQDLLFVSTADKDIQCSLQYTIEETDCDYRIMIEESQFKAKTGLTQDSLFKLLYTNVTPKEIKEGVEDEYGVIYSSDGSQLLKCKRDISSYQVKEGCRLIRKEAFIDKKLSSIILPDGLTHIGDSAFSRCKNLFSINFPDGLIHIGDKAFYRCENLYSITLPNGLMQIGEYAFLCCESLSSITLPNGLKNIGNSAFQGCKNLSSITLPNGLTHIGHKAFFETQIRKIVSETPFFVFKNGCLINVKEKKLIAFLSDDKSVDLPIGLTHIGDYAFSYYENLSNITLPNGLKNIGDSAFQGCKNLSSITLPDSLTTIGESAFSLCKCLSSITIPNKLTQISNDVFVGCENLARIAFPNCLTYIGDSAFYGCRGLTEIKLPDNLTHIGEKAFYDCVRLTRIVFPSSLSHIGESAFKNCVKLSSIEVPYGSKEVFQRILPPDLHSKLQSIIDCYIVEEMQDIKPYYLFFDTETTGVPHDYNAPARNTSNWPRLVQLGWILTDESGNEISSGNEIIKPEGFSIPSDASRVHGITTEVALRDGKPLKQVIESFLKDTKGIRCFVGHNVSFDQRVVGAELYRLGITDTVSTARSFDTMVAATDYCKIPGAYGYKWPKLIELHRKLFGCDFEDAHDAMADITATKKCFFEMKRRGLI